MSDAHPSCAEIAGNVGIVSWNDHSSFRRRTDIDTILAAAANVHDLCRFSIDENRDVVLECRGDGAESTTVVIGTAGDPTPLMRGLADRTPFLTDVLTACATILRRLDGRIAEIGKSDKAITPDALRRKDVHADVTDALGASSWNGRVEVMAPTPFIPATAKGSCFDTIGRDMADMRDRMLPLLEPVVCVVFTGVTRFDPYCRTARQDVDGMEMLRIHQRLDALLRDGS